MVWSSDLQKCCSSLLLWIFKNQKLLLQPIAAYYYTAVRMTHCHTCLYGSEVTQLFGVDPPPLEEYLA